MQRRYAFLFGANGPESSDDMPSLQHAEQDVEGIADLLKKSPCEFTHTQYEIAEDRRPLLNRLSQFLGQCAEDDLVIVFFSGYAILDGKKLYLLCKNTDPDDPEDNAIDITSIISYLTNRKKCKAKQTVIMLDCCYNSSTLE